MGLQLGVALGYWDAGPPPGVADLVAEAERLGYDSIWAAEAYGSDALTPLAWLGAGTTRVRLGTSIAQMAARTPAATAMAAMTLDHLSGGRFVLGLGASGPQVTEGWYGQPYPRPLARTREYVQIVRTLVARGRSEFTGEHFTLPVPGGTGLGKPLRSTLHPLRADLPIVLAAEGPRNVALAAEIADGWLAMFYSPYDDALYRAALAEGFAREGARRSAEDFEVFCRVNVVIDDDVEAAADRVRPYLALYIGGMGARGANFHYEVFARMGFEAECAGIQEHYLAGRRDEAAAAVTTTMVERVALVGPRAKIAEELTVWRESLLTTMTVSADVSQLAAIAELVHG
ncbi:LLM class F420-dependent oxidoreductase [Trujillonella endophytica]|uniref:Probable F420-dependent oxidoreductase, Rv3520c family n=1 Tax=Trujillonella endophytica TaxID=673521 RepID=A0A1H8VWI5_9ACTN|nr:LLM class F420-dependent oxidoreductase [Trujillella endophytica]SEP19792.1 probable F420-dependent oxidoreductase, Rv3520c family [Trujillella endophytica]